jgi:hypothetical protein
MNLYGYSCEIPACLSSIPILPNDLAGANLCATYLPRSHNMPWHAKPGCPEHHRSALERMVNALPSSYLLPPQTGEIFDSLDDCNSRQPRLFASRGFRHCQARGDTKANPSYRFKCTFHGITTQNNRELGDGVERDSERKIVNKRQKDATNVRQLPRPWSALCSFKL